MTTTAPAIDETKSLPGKLLLTGLGLGVGADILIGDVLGTGPGLTLWMTCFTLATWRLAVDSGTRHRRTIMVWSVIAVLATLVLWFRNLPEIILAMTAVLFLAATIVYMEIRGIALRQASIADCLMAFLHVPLQAITGAFPALGSVSFRESTRSPRSLATLRGFLIALPLVLLFGSLFSQADLRFEALATELLMSFSPTLPEHIVTSLVFFWLATGLLAILYTDPARKTFATDTRLSLGFEETLVIMAALAAIFITFVFLQLPYLFGGRQTIASTAGLSLADYARRGFFELVFVAALTLVTLLVMAKITRATRLYKSLAFVLLACVLVILASALQRLLLYTQAFGLTIDRVTALSFLAWIAICLAMYGYFLLRNKQRGFALGAICSALIIAFGFALLNPAAIIIRVNTSMNSTNGYEIDYLYFKILGSDGVAVLIDNFDRLPPAEQCELAFTWLQALNGQGRSQHQLNDENDWRTWNLVKVRARNAILENRRMLVTALDQQCGQ